MHTESSPSQQNSQTSIMHTDTLPTPHLTNDNPLTGSQDRQRAPLKHSRRCLENHTRNDSSMSEILDDEVLIMGLMALTRFHSPIRINAWSTYENDRVKTKSDKDIYINFKKQENWLLFK